MNTLVGRLTALLLCAALMMTMTTAVLAETDPLIAPSEAFIIECLKSVPEVSAIGAATKNNDPNGRLNIVGGYTAAVFFSTSLLNPNAVSMTADEVIKKGTTGGGCLEVYRSVEDANYRRNSLVLSGGKEVLGTVVIRLSRDLSAEDSEMLMGKIVSALKEKAYGSATHELPAAAAAPSAAEIVKKVEDHLRNKFYFSYIFSAIATGGNQSSLYDIVDKPIGAITYPTNDGNGYYVFEYYTTTPDDVHISRVTFVSSFKDMDVASKTIVAIASSLNVLPATSDDHFGTQASRFLQIINLGQSYNSGDATINAVFSEVNGSYLVCAVFEGLDR